MKVTIYGRSGCPYCTRAIQISEHLTKAKQDFSFEYIDMITEGISKEALSEKLNVPVRTVPQVLVDGNHVGGCTEYEQYCRSNSLI
ncbi:GrxA family glutaredoxin [Shewanella sp. 202IG2-18]|uniref:GrxA family glutaredoxin n=1 Tax=Parashewanella hymeniacidonis TaxID=2807618 RepID=UPI00195F2E9F|nr:GrxA family glutaredoxin [Parashewanella hymeniacidonis]MBM7070711.1 GrxA family glutaredoxin [Parashewanella hymeniacidonis]